MSGSSLVWLRELTGLPNGAGFLLAGKEELLDSFIKNI